MDVLKPDVVLYGEPVPLIEHAFDVAVSADLLLVLGSSLEVSPVNHIPLEAAHAGVMTALINYTHPHGPGVRPDDTGRYWRYLPATAQPAGLNILTARPCWLAICRRSFYF
jgi:hypothetical protein